ncbi:MAG: DUF6531 domain-containing protein, partial [Planctomycetota bacterium]
TPDFDGHIYVLEEGVDPLNQNFSGSGDANDGEAERTHELMYVLDTIDQVTLTLASVRPGVATPVDAAGVASIDSEHRKSFERDRDGRHALYLDAQQFGAKSFAPLQRQLNRLADLRNDIGVFMRGLLAMSSLQYTHQYQQQLEFVGALTQHVPVESGVRLGLVSSPYKKRLTYPDATPTSSAELQNPVLIDNAGDPSSEVRRHFVSIDLAYRTAGLIANGADDDPIIAKQRLKDARYLAGYTSSYLEHAILEEVANAKSVSTIKAFQKASSDDVAENDLTDIDPAIHTVADVDALFVDPSDPTPEPAWKQTARDAIRADFLAGYAITVTQDSVSFSTARNNTEVAWNGIAWHRFHPTLDRQGYFIMSTRGETNHVPLGGGVAIDQQLDLGEVGDDQERLSPYGSGVVNLYTGTLSYTETDISIPNPTLPLELVRYYDSGDLSGKGFGHGWGHMYSDRLTLLEKDDDEGWDEPEFAAGRVVLNAGDGSNYVFRFAHFELPDTNGDYTAVSDLDYGQLDDPRMSDPDLRAVYRLPSGTYGAFIFTNHNNTYTFTDSTGKYRRYRGKQGVDRYLLREIGDKLGNSLNVVYQGQSFNTTTTGFNVTHHGDPNKDRLTYVYYKDAVANPDENEDGIPDRYLEFVWGNDQAGSDTTRIRKVRDFAGREWEYSYVSRTQKLWNTSRDRVETHLGVLDWKVEPATSTLGGPTSDSLRDVVDVDGNATRLATNYQYQHGLYNGVKLVKSSRHYDVHPVEPTRHNGKTRWAGVPLGEYSFDYYGNGRIFAITDPEHHVEYYSFNLFSHREQDEDIDDRKTYTAAATRIDQAGQTSRTVYDLVGLSRYIVAADGSRTDQTWHMYEPPPASGDEDVRNHAEFGSWRMVERRSEVGLYESFDFGPHGTVEYLVTNAKEPSWSIVPNSHLAAFQPFNDGIVTENEYQFETIGLNRGTMEIVHGPKKVTQSAATGGSLVDPRVTVTDYNSFGLPERTTVAINTSDVIETEFDYVLDATSTATNGLIAAKRLPRYFDNRTPGWQKDQFIETYAYDPKNSGQIASTSRGGGVGTLASATHDTLGLGRALT